MHSRWRRGNGTVGPATKRQLIQSPVKHLAWALLRYTDRGDDLGRAIGNAVEAEVEVLLLTASVVALGRLGRPPQQEVLPPPPYPYRL